MKTKEERARYIPPYLLDGEPYGKEDLMNLFEKIQIDALNCKKNLLEFSLTNDIDQKNPLAFLVFCYNDMDNDYMIFTEETGAKDYAMQQEELADYPEGTWPIYPLYAGEKLKFLI